MEFDLSRMRIGSVREFKGPDGTITVTRQENDEDLPTLNVYLIVFDTEDVLLEFIIQDYYGGRFDETKIYALDSSKSKNGYSNNPKKMTEDELNAFDKFLNKWVPPNQRDTMNRWVLDRWNALIKGSYDNPLTVIELSPEVAFAYVPSMEEYSREYARYGITGYAYKGHGSREYPVRLMNTRINGEYPQIGTVVIKHEGNDLSFSFETADEYFSCSGKLSPKERRFDMWDNLYYTKAVARIEAINDSDDSFRHIFPNVKGKEDMEAILKAIVFAENSDGPWAKEFGRSTNKEPVVETKRSKIPFIGGIAAIIGSAFFLKSRLK